MVVVIADSCFESSGRSRWLKTTDEPLGDEDAERVVHRLEGNRTDLSSNGFGHSISCDVRLRSHHAEHCQSLRCDLDASLPQELSGFGVHGNMLDQILE